MHASHCRYGEIWYRFLTPLVRVDSGAPKRDMKASFSFGPLVAPLSLSLSSLSLSLSHKVKLVLCECCGRLLDCLLSYPNNSLLEEGYMNQGKDQGLCLLGKSIWHGLLLTLSLTQQTPPKARKAVGNKEF